MKMVKQLLSVVAALATMVALAANRVIDVSDSEKIQIFDVPGNYVWTAPNNLIGTAQLLVVGGGGAGGGISGGGGGGGQVIYNSAVAIEPGKNYTVAVADGGIATTGNGANGGDSSISADGFTTVTAVGGGGGGGGWSSVSGKDGANGGGSGGNGNSTAKAGGSPTVAGGHYGAASAAVNWGYGGGGGMGEDGHVYNDPEKPGYGGAGVTNEITGAWVMYGYGGGAARSAKTPALSGAGDEWGKGYVTTGNVEPTPGEEGTGGGGGGGKINTGGSYGGDGGSGTVIIRYTLDTAKDDFSANITRSIRVPTTVTFTAQLGTPLSEMTWNFGDGSATVTTTDLSVQHEYSAAGLYTVTMTHGSQIVTKTDYVEIISGVLYVDVNSTNPQPPYDTRATAAVKVTDAMKYAENGFEVRIAPGEYQLKELFSSNFQYAGYSWKGNPLPLLVSNAVHIVGEGSSPTSVVIRSMWRRPYYIEHVALVDNAEAFIENLTMADGSASNQGWGGSVWITAKGGTVSNCVIRNGYASIPVQAKTGGAYLSGGLLTHCVIEDCTFNGTIYKDALKQLDLGTSRLASGAYVTGSGRIENCLFKNCGSDFGDVVVVADTKASLVNCTIVDGRTGYWTSKNTYNNEPITISGVEYAKGKVILSSVTNDGYAVGCSAGVVKNCAVYNVKRVAYLDRPETYEAVFGPEAAKFTTCVAATKGDFQNYDAGKLTPAPFGALYNKGTEISGYSGMKDLAGNDRVQGKAIDIGCYESPVAGMQIIIR